MKCEKPFLQTSMSGNTVIITESKHLLDERTITFFYFTVDPDSMFSASFVPHFFMLQSYSQMFKVISYFKILHIPCDDKVKKAGLKFLQIYPRVKTHCNHMQQK